MRNVSAGYCVPHAKFGFVPWDSCRVRELGDVPLPEPMVNDVCVEHIEAYYKRLDAAGVRPVSMGGDHAISGPIIKALAGADAALTGGRKAALLQFDAHTDCYDHLEHWFGNRRSAAHWASYVVHEGHIDAERSVQLGIRGNASILNPEQYPESLGYRVIPMDEFEQLGVDATIEIIRNRVGNAPLYISFDLDSIDPTAAPAVSNIEAGAGDQDPAGVARARHHRCRRRLPDAHQGQPEPDHLDDRDGADVRAGGADRRQPAHPGFLTRLLSGLPRTIKSPVVVWPQWAEQIVRRDDPLPSG